MKFLLIIILAAGGFFYYNHSKKVEAFKEYTSGSASKGENSSGDFKEFNQSPEQYRGLSKNDTIEVAIGNVRSLHNQFNNQLKAASKKSGAAKKAMIDTFIKNYIKTLGKAYTASKDSNKAALKTLKTFVVNWYQRMGYLELKEDELIGLLEHGVNGNLNELQASNRYALIELSKVIKQDDSYLSSFKNNFNSAIKKHSITNSHINSYARKITSDVQTATNQRKIVNKSLSNLVDKYYALNSYVLRNNKNGQLTVSNRGKWQALLTIVSEIETAEKDYNRKVSAYYNSY